MNRILFLLFAMMPMLLMAQSYSDNATNYGGSWTNSSNQGSGFGAWTLSAGASSGGYIGNPSSDGMGTTGIGTTAFGMYATGSAYFNASRPITNGMGVGDTLKFYWAINFDAGAGNKGFDLKSGSSTIFNVNNTGSATISTTNGNANTNYGTAPMLVTLIRTSSSAYSFAMTSRSGGADYTTTITNSSSIDAINFYIGAQNDGAGQKNMYANAFSLRKFGQYRSRQTGNWNDAATWEFSRDGGTSWATANTVPKSSLDGTIVIRNAHTVTINTTVNTDQTTINAGGKVILATGGSLTVDNGADANDLVINGTYERTASATSMTPTGTVSCGSGGLYIHNVNGGTIPTITWNANSTLQIDQSIANDEFTESFGNVVVNGSSTFFISTTSVSYTGSIQGNFTHNSTGAIALKNTSFDATFTISGNLSITGGGTFRIMEGVGSSISKSQKVIVNGNFSLTSGTLNLSNETSSTVSASTVFALLEVKGNFTHTGGTISETASDADVVTRITLTGTAGTQTIESTGQTGTVNFNVAGSNAQCVVSSGKTFVLGSGGMTVAAGTATPDLSVDGTFRNSGGTVTTTGTVTFNASSNYEHNTGSGGAVPTASWNTSSNCRITSSGTTLPTGLGQNFGNFEWANSTHGATNIQMSAVMTSIQGSFTVSNTGTGSLRYNSGTPASPIFTIGGDFVISGGIFDFTNGTSTPTFNISGNINQSGGTISRSGSGTTTINLIKSSGLQTFTQSSGSITATANWNVGNGSTTNTVQLASNVNLGSGTGTLRVLNGANFDAQGFVMSGSNAFASNNGSTITTSNTSGLNGSITSSGTKTLNDTTNYVFNGASAQVTGALLTSANNLTINNSAGLSLSSNTQVLGTLTFTNGSLTTNAKTLTLVNTPSGTSSSRYIITDATGTVTMNAVSTAKTIPIGTSTSYAPITVAAATSTNYTATVSSTLPCSATDATKVVNLAWNLNGSTAPSSVVFQWNAGNQAGSFAPGTSCELGRYNTACPYSVTTIGAASGSGPYTLTATSGLASGNNTYVVGNNNAVYLAPPTVNTTVAASSITHNSASSGGQTITGASITAKGVVWNTSTAPTVALSTKTDNGTGTSDFTSSLTSLSAETLYYIRAYATNASGTGYGDEKTFRTLSAPATAQASGFSATATSSSNIDLSWTGATFPGSGATASGYILLRATSPNSPSLASSNGSAPSAGTNTTIVSSSIASNATSFSNSGLASTTTYNYLLVPYTWDGTNTSTYNYLTGSAPTANATTNSGATAPILSTSAATAITASAATLNGNVTSDGGASVTSRGFVYSTSDNTPTIGESGVTDQSSGSGTGAFSETVSLSANTTYYYQAYATNSAGTNYGGVESFTTPKAEPTAQPTSLVFSSVTTSAFNTAFTAASGSPDGYIVIRSTSSSLSENPADGTTYTAGNSLGGGTILSVGSTISGISSSSLSAGTTYYVFVFAYNNSNEQTDYLTTAPLSSSVITVTNAPNAPSFSAMTTTTGTVSWSAVTGASSYKLDVSTSSSFTSFVSGYEDLTVSGTSEALTGLTPNTVYYARLRAVNASGTSSSSANGSGTTLHNAPTVGAGSGATTSAITANWTAPTGGGAASFTYTVELSTDAGNFSSPVATQSSIASGTTTFQFTGLTQGTTYYFRVKAVNTTGSSDWSSVSAGYATLSTTISINVLGTAVTENFNGMGTSGTASTPTGIRIGTDYSTALSATTLAYGNTGTGVVTSSSSGGAINWADGVTGSATERALGFLTTGSYTSPRSIVAAFKNNTGSTITNLQINWNYEKYRSGSRAIDWTFFHGSTAAPTTAATDGNQSYAADANNTTIFSPSSNIAKSVLLTGLSIADGATYYIMWTYTGNGGSTNSQGLAIDDLSIKGCGTVSAPTASNQSFCSAANATVGNLVATGANIQWYAAASGGTALSTAAALTNNTTYYATQTVDGCESVSRTAVTVTINTSPSAPTGSAAQSFCTSASPTVANLTATGSNIQWYAASSGGSALSSSFALSDNGTYYASQTVDGCESSTRLAVTVSFVADGTWTGTTSTDWHTASNWCGGVPSASTNVIIPSGTANNPVISSTAAAATITINTGATLSFSGTPTLTVSGNLTNNGTFTAGSGTVAFNATATVSGTVAFNNLSLSAALNPGTATTVNGTLSLNNGGSISTNSPLFGASSTLNYNFGGGFGARRNQSLEWPSTNGPANLSITNGSWIQLTGNRSLTGNATITNGALQASGARTLTMNGSTQTITVSTSSGGAIYGTDNGFGNDLNLAIANGSTTTFTGDATSSNDDEKKFLGINVNAGGTLVLSRGILCKYGTFTVDGTLQINAGGYVQGTSGNSPTYGSSSVLKYNNGSAYGRGVEWNATSGAGYPNHVQVSNNSTLNASNGSNNALQIAGNLTIDNGSSFSLEGLTNAGFTVGLNVLGNVSNDGTLTLATSTERLKCVNYTNGSNGTTTLSTSGGGDLEVTGDLIDNGLFNSNTRAVFFTGTGTQNISGSGTFNIDYLVSNKASGKVRMLNNLLCEGPNGGNAITLSNSTDTLDLNGFTLTIGKSGVTSGFSGNGVLLGGSSSSLIVNGNGNAGTLRMVQSNPGTSNALQSITIDRASTGLLTLGNNLSVGSVTLSNGTLDMASNTMTITGSTVNRTSGAIDADAGTITFANASALTLPASVYSGNVNNFTLNGIGGVTIGSDVTVTNTLTLTNGNLRVSNANLILGASAAISGSPSSTNMIVTNGSGYVRKLTSATGSFTFPVGDETGTTEYSPVTVNLASGTVGSGAYVQARAVNTKHPNNNNTTDYLNRYWSVEQSGITSFSAVVSALYTGADVVGSSSSILMGKWNGSNPWVRYASSNNAGTQTLTSPSLSSFSDFTGLSGGTPTASLSAGSSTLCNGGSTLLTATATGDAPISYSWSVGAATTDTLTVSPTVTTTYTVTVTDANGLTATASVTINVNQPTTSDTTAAACDEFTWYGNTYTTSGNYTRTLSNAVGCDSVITLHLTINTFTTSDTTATACVSFVWNGNTYTVSGDYDYGLTNANGCDSIRTLHLTINPLPSAPGAISGPLEVCTLIGDTTPTTYSIAPVSGVTSYNWTVPTGVTIVSGQGTHSINVTFTNSLATTSQRIRVYTVSETGCSGLTASSFITLTKTVPARANFNGPLNVCAYAGQNTTATYTCDSVARAHTYTWTVPTGATLVSGQGTRTIQVQFASTYTSGSITVTTIGNCGSAAPLSKSILATRPATPASISGPTNACSYITGATQATYTIAAVSGADSYLWTVPTGVTIVSGQGTTSLTVTFGNNFVSAHIQVRSVAICGSSNNCLLLVNGRNYAAPSSLTGPTNACAFINNDAQATYITRKVANAPGYLWTVPQGVTIISHPGGTGVNDTIINVTFDSSFVFGSQILVQSSGCGLSAARSLTISGSIPTRPGAITGPVNACSFMESVASPNGNTATYTIRKNPAASYYVWTAPADATIVSHPGGLGVNDTIVLVKFSSSYLTGVLRVRSANACGVSDSTRLTISRLNVGMPGLIDVIQLGECPNRVYRYSLSSMPSNATSVAWAVPSGASITSGQGTPTITVSYPSSVVSGTVTAQAVNNCSSSAPRILNIKFQACPISFTGNTSTSKASDVIAPQSMDVQVLPNPSSHLFVVQPKGFDNAQPIIVRVLDQQGRVVLLSKKAPLQTMRLGEQLKAGIYLLELRQGDHRVTQKLIKE